MRIARDDDGRILGLLALVLFRIRPACAPGSRMSSSMAVRADEAWVAC
jgi:hypothetical protein